MTATPQDARIGNAPGRAAVRQAAHWLSRLQADASPATRAACQAWCNAHPEHELAWQRIQALAGQFSATGTGLDASLHGVLHHVTAQEARRQKLKWILGMAGAGAIAWMADGDQIVRTQLADHRTATGQRSATLLADGTHLTLNTRSAADIDINASRRVVTLLGGEIHIQTAPDPLGRPFLVQTRAGTLAPVGTRFLARELDTGGNAVRVSVLEGAVDIQLPGATTHVAAGQLCDFRASGADAPQASSRSAAAWLNGMLVVDRMPLRGFLHELNRYRAGNLGCDDTLASLQVTGAFSIDDTDATLDLLSRTLPVRIASRTRYWVRVLPA